MLLFSVINVGKSNLLGLVGSRSLICVRRDGIKGRLIPRAPHISLIVTWKSHDSWKNEEIDIFWPDRVSYTLCHHDWHAIWHGDSVPPEIQSSILIRISDRCSRKEPLSAWTIVKHTDFDDVTTHLAGITQSDLAIASLVSNLADDMKMRLWWSMHQALHPHHK